MSLSKVLNSQLEIIRTAASDELARLASYCNWPASAAVRPCALSRHGFTYEGLGDRTRCVACGIVVENWRRGDRPEDVHRNRSPMCPLVVAETSSSSTGVYDVGYTRTQLQQLSVNEPQASIRSDGEILTPAALPASSSLAGEPSASAAGPSVQEPGVMTSSTVSASCAVDRRRADLVQLRCESVRLSTFHDWPSSAGRIVSPRDLAATGLFYTGHDDRVQCAFCRGCLRSWKPGDQAEQEHRRHFPDCPLVRGAATGNIPCDVSSSATLMDLQLATSQPHPTPFPVGELVVKSSNDNADRQGSVTMSGDAISSASTDTVPASSTPAVATAAAAALGAEDVTVEMDEECAAELEENKRLREARTCKVCMDSEVNTVFLPCGHLVCCDTCSPALRNCAVCRALIRGTVKVFLG